MSPEQKINVLIRAYQETGREAFRARAKKLKREQARTYRESSKSINLTSRRIAA
jgi:hypothetical protein